MKKGGYCLALLLLVALAALMSDWAAGEAGAASQDKTPVMEEEATDTPKGEQSPRQAQIVYPGTFGPIITDTAVPIQKGMLAIQPTFYLGFVTNTLDRNWRRVSAGGDFGSFSMKYKLTYGIWDKLECFVVIPILINWVTNADEPGPHGERAATQGGLGDLNLTLKYRLAEEGPKIPTITALFAADFPTGRFRNLNPSNLGVDALGSGAYVFTAGLNMSKCMKPFVLYGNLWYSLSTAFTDDFGREYPRDFVTVNLAAEYCLTKRWRALIELTSFWDTGRLFGHRANTHPQALISMMPGLEYMAMEKFSLAFGVSVDLAGKNSDAAVTPILSMVYAF